MVTTSELLSRIEAHCRTRGMAESTFGRKAANDGKLVDRLRNGRTITLETVARIEAELAKPMNEAQPPAGAAA